MCLACIAKHAGMSSEAIETDITVIGRVLAIHQKWNLCGSCGVPAMLYFLKRPPHWPMNG